MKIKIRDIPTFYKILFPSIAITLMVTLTSTIFTYNKASEIILKKTVRQSQETVRQMSENYENFMQGIYDKINYIAYSATTQEELCYGEKGAYEEGYFSRERELKRQMVRLFNSFYVDDLQIYAKNGKDYYFSVKQEVKKPEKEEIAKKILKNVNFASEGAVLILYEKNQIVQGQASELSKKADQLFQATEGEFEYQMQKKKYQVVYRVSDTTKWKVIGIIPLREISADLLPIQKQMIKTLMIGIFISSILSFLLSYVIVRPIRATVLAMHRFSEGDFEVRLSEERKDEFGEMNRVFNETTRKIEELMHEVTNSKLLNKEMEFKALQAQINPHFLYNALDTVNWMAMKKGDTEICDMVSAISNLMRISIGNKQDIFSIRQELKYVKDYLYIQETRYRDRFQVYFAIDEKILDEKIPKLTIQPLVENAIVHSVEVSKGKTVLNINGYIEQGNVVIEIKDDGVGMDRDTLLHLLDPPEGEEKDISVAHTGLGMYAVHQRLRYLYGEEYGLTADSEPGNGTCIKICIPFTKGEEKTWS